MDIKKSNSKVAWNAAEGIIMEISNRRNLANTYFIQGNIQRAFQTLVAIKQSVVQSFHAEERKKLEEIEQKFFKITTFLANANSNSFIPEVREAHRLSRKIALKIYPEYNDYLMDLLQDRGYLVGEQTDASKMKF